MIRPLKTAPDRLDLDHLDAVVHNAGVARNAPPRRETGDGREPMSGTNHLGHFTRPGPEPVPGTSAGLAWPSGAGCRSAIMCAQPTARLGRFLGRDEALPQVAGSTILRTGAILSVAPQSKSARSNPTAPRPMSFWSRRVSGTAKRKLRSTEARSDTAGISASMNTAVAHRAGRGRGCHRRRCCSPTYDAIPVLHLLGE